MYSTDGGEFHYHTKSHLTKLVAFFILMLVISFFNIKFWHLCSYFLYGIIILLLIWVSIYGIKASGSQRWINLYFFSFTTIRINENRNNSLSCKILSPIES
jgi:rod shape determining protein RodA